MEIEGNAIGGTSTDGNKCCNFTDAGRLVFNSCHLESNDCQYGIYFRGQVADESSIVLQGCTNLAGLGTIVDAGTCDLTYINSFVSSGTSTNDTYLNSGVNVCSINSYTTFQNEDSAASSYVLGGFSNLSSSSNSLRFASRTARLDDYDTGTWADASLGLLNCSSVTLSEATYTKVGRLVYLCGTFSGTLTTTGTATQVTFNLPFNTLTNSYPLVGHGSHSLSSDGFGVTVDTTGGESSSATVVIPASQVTAANGSSFTVRIALTYEAA